MTAATRPDGDLVARIEAGIALAKAGDAAAAAEWLRQVASDYPESADAHFNLGVACRAAQQEAPALEAFAAAVRCAPQWAEAHFNLGNAQRDSGDRAAAMRSFQQALAHQPNYLKAINNLANLCSDQGDFGAAEKLLQRLSPAERHVLERFMQGESDPQIGKRLEKTAHTVSNQLAAIEGKWHVHSRVELLALALNSWHQSHQSQKPPA